MTIRVRSRKANPPFRSMTTPTEPVQLLNHRERELIALALLLGQGKSEAVTERVRQLRRKGFVSTELLEVALVATTEINRPQALKWVNDGLELGLNA